MPLQPGKFLLNGQPLEILTITRILPTIDNGYVEIGVFDTTAGLHSMFVASRINTHEYAVSKQHSFTVQYNQTSGQWAMITPLDSTVSSINDYALDAKIAGTKMYLRIRRLSGNTSGVVYLTAQNAAVTDSSFVQMHGTGVAMPPTSFIGSMSAGEGDIDHDNLIHRGEIRHPDIDTHIKSQHPHTGHEITEMKNQPGGYAGLDAAGKISAAIVPTGSTPGTLCSGDDVRLTGGSSNAVRIEAGMILSGHRVVAADMLGKLVYADCLTPAHMTKVIGVITNSAATGEKVTVYSYGEVEHLGWNWDVNLPVYLGEDGQMVQTVPASGFLIQLGFVRTPTKLFLDLKEPIILA